MRKQWLIWSMALIGILMIAYPTLKDSYYDWQQARILADLEARLAASAPLPVTPSISEGANLTREYEQLNDLFGQETEETPPIDPQALLGDAVALLEIDKIDLKLPVLSGATKENMDVAAAHMTETSPLGQSGNAAIAAHRARVDGRMFNRLDEMDVGDHIRLLTAEGDELYTVFDVMLVDPTDVSVLYPIEDEQIITLITCEPSINPTHRIIVQAKLDNG